MQLNKTLRIFSKRTPSHSSWEQDTAVGEKPSAAPSTLSHADIAKESPLEGNVVPESRADEPTAARAENVAPAAANISEGAAVQENIAKEKELDETVEEEPEYPSGLKLAIISIALCLSVFLVALDNTIIATAIPRITDQFHALNDIGWYGSAYFLTICSFQLFFGKLYTFFSIKWVYLTAIAIFELGSLICGVAPNSITLIIGRAVAGIGSAGIFSGALIIIAYTVPLIKRPIFQGIIGAMYGVASVAGPLMGGAFTDHLSWRWWYVLCKTSGDFNCKD